MGTITSGIGLASGINTGNIIEQLVRLERRPIEQLQLRIAGSTETKIAYADLSTRLNTIKGVGTDLRRPSTFDAVAARSGEEQVATVTANVGAPEGRYELRVQSLVQAQQTVTNGFASRDARVGAGRITLEVGGRTLRTSTPLASLNGGQGIGAGKFRVSDNFGRTKSFDASDYTTLEDLAEAIATTTQIDVAATVAGGRLMLTDESGGGGTLRVRDLGDGQAAKRLGLTAESWESGTRTTITAPPPVTLSPDTPLSMLNEGQGITFESEDDLRITDRRGTTYDVNLSGATTVAEVMTRFNTATSGRVSLSLTPGADGFTVTDTSGGRIPAILSSAVQVRSLGSSGVATQLGIELTAPDNTTTSLAGDPLLIHPGAVPTASLRGGQGLGVGTFKVTNTAGQAVNIDGSSKDLHEILTQINASGIGVEAKINDAGNGVLLIDSARGPGTLRVDDVNGTVAANLGLTDAGPAGTRRIDGGNIQPVWVTRATPLSTYDAGRPVAAGKIEVTDSAGVKATLDLTSGGYRTVGALIDAVNALPTGITLRVNDNGDGLLLTDTAGGSGVISVVDVDGSAAKALRIAGESTSGMIDGSFEVGFDVAATDTLEAVRDKINALGYAVRAEVLNDGTPDTPWRIGLTARSAGEGARFIFDPGTTTLGGRTVAAARDATVHIGGGDFAPLTVRSRTNTLENVLPGLSVDLVGTNNGRPVEITVSTDASKATDAVKKLVESFNGLRDSIDEKTKFSPETNRRGVLLGEPTVQRAERDVYRLLRQVYDTGNPRFRILSDVGLRLGEGARLEFDETRFREAWDEDPEALKAMFTASTDGRGTGFGHRLQDTITTLTDPVDGTFARANKGIDTKNSEFEARIRRMEAVVTVKEQRLQKQFLDMELALSKLQFQQQQITSMPMFNFQNGNGGGNGR